MEAISHMRAEDYYDIRSAVNYADSCILANLTHVQHDDTVTGL